MERKMRRRRMRLELIAERAMKKSLLGLTKIDRKRKEAIRIITGVQAVVENIKAGNIARRND